MKSPSLWLKTALTCLLMLTAGCMSWITPTVNTEVATLKAGQFKLDPNHAALMFKIQHLGLSTYVGRFNQFDASLDFDPDNISAAKLSAIVDISSIDVNNDDLSETLQDSTWFDSVNYPQATFVSQRVEPRDKGQFAFTGLLTLRGVTKTAVFIATFHGGADNWMTGKYTLGFSAIGSIKRSDFGMSSYIPLVGDEVQLEIHAEFLKQSPSP